MRCRWKEGDLNIKQGSTLFCSGACLVVWFLWRESGLLGALTLKLKSSTKPSDHQGGAPDVDHQVSLGVCVINKVHPEVDRQAMVKPLEIQLPPVPFRILVPEFHVAHTIPGTRMQVEFIYSPSVCICILDELGVFHLILGANLRFSTLRCASYRATFRVSRADVRT